MDEDYERELRGLAASARHYARMEAGASPMRDFLKCAAYLNAAHVFDRELEIHLERKEERL